MVSAMLLVAGCFQSQSYLLPVFVWSFLSLLMAWLLTKAPASSRPDRGNFHVVQWAQIALLVGLLGGVIANAKSVVSVVYLLSSMGCSVLTASIIRRRPNLLHSALRIFLILHVVLAAIGVIALTQFNATDLFFVAAERGGYFRLRGIALEPNHLGFSLSAIYIIVLFLPRRYKPWKRGEFALTIATIWGLACLTFSPFALTTIVVTTVIYSWTTPRRKLTCVFVLLIASSIMVQTERFAQTVEGADNSANLRTWGAFVIAQAQVDKCGVAGCGIGNSRSVLAGEPLMATFAAQETLVLPNLFAGALVEGGYFFALFFLLVIFFATMPNGYDRRGNSWRSRIACFLLLLLFAMSGSYPYDAHFWTIVGLLYVLVRTDSNKVKLNESKKDIPLR